jgi:hypothetical protein
MASSRFNTKELVLIGKWKGKERLDMARKAKERK